MRGAYVATAAAMTMRELARKRLVLVLALCVPAVLFAAEFATEGNQIVRVRFAVRVQYLSHAPLDAAALVEISFLIVSSEAQQSTVEERRRLPGRGALPTVTVAYPVQPSALTKRLKVEFSRTAKFNVRPGRDNRSIEIVIAGAGKDMSAARPAESPAPAPQFAITLQTFPTGDFSGARQVPGQFQDYSLFSSQTVRDGKPEHELNLGYFATQEQAERVRLQLLQRFPNARVVDLARRREESLRATAKAAAPPVAAPPIAAPPVAAPPVAAPPAPLLAAPQTDVDKSAAQLMSSGRAALASGKPETATELFNQLLEEYLARMLDEVAVERRAKLKAAGMDKIYFAWAGGLNRGDLHYYRLQGPTFLVEYDNTQNDGNHIHSVWRDFNGDFGADLLREHYKATPHDSTKK